VTALLPEHIVDESTDLLTLNLAAAGNSTFDVHVDLVIQLDGLDVSLPITIHHAVGPATLSDPLHARRVSVFR
jgi:hypothetical protein